MITLHIFITSFNGSFVAFYRISRVFVQLNVIPLSSNSNGTPFNAYALDCARERDSVCFLLFF